MTDPEARILQERVWNAFPVAQPAFAKLLSLLDFEVTRDVPTAAVSLGHRSRLRINPDFAAKHCGDDPALVMLVMHELFHVVLGHTRLYERCSPTQNLAFDAVINAQLCLLFPHPEWTRLFRDLYGPQDQPCFLLRPPEGWRTPAERWLRGSAGTLHRRLYTDESLSYEDLFRLLEDAAGGEVPAGLLGSHGAGPGEAVDPDLLAEIREIIAEWPEIRQRSGRDQGGQERAFRVEGRERRRSAVAVLRQALRTLRDQNADGTGKLHSSAATTPSILPHRTSGDRRAAVQEACGDEPLLYTGDLPRRAYRRGERVHVYLDVSGSMDALIGPLYTALAQLTAWMTPALHLFSTTVKDITQEELKRGKGATTGGTDISVVTAHMVKTGVRRALVVTDGWVGKVPAEHGRELARRKGRFAVALSAGGDPAFARGLQARVWNLPNLNQEPR